MLPGSVADGIAKASPGAGEQRLEIEHPTGFFTVDMDVVVNNGDVSIRRSALLRTARKLMRGEVYIPSKVWDRK